MNKNEMALFEVEEVNMIDVGVCDMILVRLSIPERGRAVFGIFLLAETHERQIESFFESIGEHAPNNYYNVDWDETVGKRGICVLEECGRVLSYLKIPGVTELIQRRGSDKVSWKLGMVEEKTRNEIQYAKQYLEHALAELDKMEPNAESFDETKETVRGTLSNYVWHGLTAVENGMLELRDEIEKEADKNC